ncbi:uncharacterized protein [Arachis hypogaea]|uniref:uncharacterized protein n=1 Tax=Arachis hypogaea TaxID=3818 RepID=UPI000DECD1EE|nr:uncharacterized protein LOC112733292 [Arachis hypogaea]
MKDYTIRRGVDYRVYELEPTTFYAKCTQYGKGFDWLIRVTKMQKKLTISQDHSKLDSKTVAEAIKPLVEVDPSLKVKSVIVEVQSKFNYTISYRKAWLAKQKAVESIFGGWEASYEALPIWFEAMCHKEPSAVAHFETMPVYQGMNWAFRHCKPVVQVDETHLYGKYKGCLLVAVSQDSNNNIVPVAFAIVEGETSDVWSAINRSNGTWSPPRAFHMFCIRHIESNFLRKFKAPYLQKLIFNIVFNDIHVLLAFHLTTSCSGEGNDIGKHSFHDPSYATCHKTIS